MALVGTEGEFLYKQGTDDKLEKSLAQCGTDLKELVKTKYGYLLSESVGKTEWKLCVLVTQKDLWAEGRFVLVFFLLSFLLSLFLIKCAFSLSKPVFIKHLHLIANHSAVSICGQRADLYWYFFCFRSCCPFF